MVDKSVRLNIREHTKLTVSDLVANGIMIGAPVALMGLLVWVFYL